jgi:hypothetical protein
MRILLLLLAIAATVCAQSPASNGSVPGWQSIVNSMLSQNSRAAPARVVPMAQNLAATKPAPVLVARLDARAPEGPTHCSVPLLQAHIPNDVNFTMRTIEPPTDKVDHMQVIVPAPACTESPR